MSSMPHYRLYIDGEWVEGAAGQVLSSENPANGESWATFACAAPGDVDRAVAAAARALEDPSWRDLTQTARGKLLYRLAELIDLWWQEAERHGVLPLDDRTLALFASHPSDHSAHRTDRRYRYRPPMSPIPSGSSAGTGGYAFDLTAKVTSSVLNSNSRSRKTSMVVRTLSRKRHRVGGDTE